MTFKQALQKFLRKKFFLFLRFNYNFDLKNIEYIRKKKEYTWADALLKPDSNETTLFAKLLDVLEQDVKLQTYLEANNMKTDWSDCMAVNYIIENRIVVTVYRYLQRYYNDVTLKKIKIRDKKLKLAEENEAEARKLVKDEKYEERQCFIDFYNIIEVGGEDEIENITKGGA